MNEASIQYISIVPKTKFKHKMVPKLYDWMRQASNASPFRIRWSIPYTLDQERLACHIKYILIKSMHRLTRTKRDTIWTKTPSKPRGHTNVWHEKVVQIISKSKTLDSKKQQHMKWDIKRNQIKQHMRDKTPIEDKIPLGEKIPRRG